MDFFAGFVSNTCAGSGNQYVFTQDADTVHTGRMFLRIFQGGSFRYSLLFSNVIDSTFAAGEVSRSGMVCPAWTILSAGVARCRLPDPAALEDSVFQPLLFEGSTTKEAAPGEIFCCDPFPMEFQGGDYLCLQITFRGEQIPYHEETLLPVFRKEGSCWIPCKQMPFPGMVGCDRAVKGRIGYLGDSITQGIGTEPNSYAHWNALLSEKLGADYAYWNLGLGYGRASDLASDGSWLYKAKQNDYIVLCCGVNDILQGCSQEQLIQDLDRIVSRLRDAGVKLLLQTIPPFDYSGEQIRIWKNVNQYILSTLSARADGVFDVVPVLGKSPRQPHMAKYGGHPDAEGCRVWAEALYPSIMEFLSREEYI